MEILQILLFAAIGVIVYFVADICKSLCAIEAKLDEISKKMDSSN